MNKYHSITIGILEQAIEIGFHDKKSKEIIEYLFRDIPRLESDNIIHFDVVAVGSEPMYSLWKGEKCLYFGASKYKLAYTLINEVIYYYIADNRSNFAVHAAAIHKGDHAIILPGKSGSGKSTLTAWLLSHGYGYLTDELALLTSEGKIVPFSRPISFKTAIPGFLKETVEGHEDQIIEENSGSMIAHRLLNPEFQTIQPKITEIVYPVFKAGEKTTVSEVSPGRSCLMLMESYVNARNHVSHGVSEIATFVRGCRSFKISYGSFSGFEEIFHRMLDG